MRFSTSSSAAAALVALASLASAQTSTKCNPLSQSCPADKALGKTLNIDFASGSSSAFTADGSYFSYNSNGAQLAMKEAGNSPTFISPWYIMFGRYDVVMQSASGTGVCSSIVLQSDDLDEIDWEMLGYQPTQGQTNYFGKGITGDFNRGLTVSVPGSTSQFNTYSVDWNAERIIWEVNGSPVRTLTAADAEANQYPQSPMQLKIGAWTPGAPSNPPGTISWSGGPVDFSQGPFVMQVKSVKVQDYSTGSEYQYDGTSGTWESIKAVGGTVGSQGTANSVSGSSSSGSSSDQPGSASSVVSVPATFTTIPAGTHKSSSEISTHSTYPWVSTGGTQITTSSSSSSVSAASSTVSPSSSTTTSSSQTSATPVPTSQADTTTNNSPGSVVPSALAVFVSTVAVVAGVCTSWLL